MVSALLAAIRSFYYAGSVVILPKGEGLQDITGMYIPDGFGLPSRPTDWLIAVFNALAYGIAVYTLVKSTIE
ncbi:MAG: hypothetical protein OEY64_09855 [Nitrospinota bacterium]|nr:hypothetical protein [Nitrospinota bacterium]